MPEGATLVGLEVAESRGGDLLTDHGLAVICRVGRIAELEGHHPDLHLQGYNNVVAEVTTHAAGGLAR